MIPVFITIIWAYHLLYNANVARGTAMMNARSAAWENAMEGCTFQETGSCDGDGCGEGSAASDSLNGENGGWIADLLGGLFGPPANGASSVAYDVGGTPWGLMSGGSANADVRLVCNTKRQTLWDILVEAMCSVPVLGPILSFINFCD